MAETASSHQEIVEVIRRLLRLSDVQGVVPAGEGCDHWAFDVNGVFIARVRKERDEHTADAVEREVSLLTMLSGISPIPIPEVVAVEPRAGLMIYRRLPGAPLFETLSFDPQAIAEPLAEFVAAINGVRSASVEHLVPRHEYPPSGYLGEAADQLPRISTCLTSAQRLRVELFLASPPPPESDKRTLCHNDLGAEHILASEDGAELTGIIDWSDAALADPASDVGLLLRDFGYGVADTVLRRIGGDESMRTRATFYARCGLLEDLAYGMNTGRPRYIAHALGRFAETF